MTKWKSCSPKNFKLKFRDAEEGEIVETIEGPTTANIGYKIVSSDDYGVILLSEEEFNEAFDILVDDPSEDEGSSQDSNQTDQKKDLTNLLETYLRRSRTGEIDGVLLIATLGNRVAFTAYSCLTPQAFGEISIAMQAINAELVRQWIAISTTKDSGKPKIHGV